MRKQSAIGAAVVFSVLLIGIVPAAAQVLIKTVAGTNWVFPPSTIGGPATNAPFGALWDMWVDPSNNVYVSDAGNENVWKMSPSGVLSLVAGNGTCCYSGDGGPATLAQLQGPRKMIGDSLGNLYIADGYNNRIRKIDSSGIITTFAGTGAYNYTGDNGQATAATMRNPFGLAFDSGGNLYVAESANHVIRKISTTGIITTFAGTGAGAGTGTGGYNGDNIPATTAQLNWPTGVVFDAAGNLYIADQNNRRVRMVTPGGTISTYAGNGACCYSGDGGPATAANMNGPYELAFDGNGNLNVVDVSNNTVRVIAGGIITTVAGNGNCCSFSGDGGAPTSAVLWNPQGVGFDSSGNMYIADSQNYRVRKVSGTLISTFAGNGNFQFAGDSGPAVSANLYSPQRAAVDAAGNLYIADMNNNRVRKVANGTITTFAGNGNCCYNGDGIPATTANLNRPQGMAADSHGNVYVADTNNNRIRKIDSSGNITAFAGNGNCCFGGDGGPAISANLNAPQGMGLDGLGNLYFADTNNHRVRKVKTDGSIETVAGNGVSGYSGDGGLAVNAQLSYPGGVAVDGAGNVYIADSNNYRIRIVSTAGVISTAAGNGSCCYPGDGNPATATAINYPRDVATDSQGNFYIADSQRVVRVNAAGIITTAAGNGNCCFSGDGGPATQARFNNVNGVTVDAQGRLYITDPPNNRVRSVSPADGYINARNGSFALGGTARIPIWLTLNSGVSVDGLNFAVTVTPNGSAPALVAPLLFQADPALSAPTIDNSAANNVVSVVFSGLATALTTGTHLGDVIVAAPNVGLALGQTYNVQVSGASGSLSSTNSTVTLTQGTAATILVAQSYFIGDVAPSTADTAGSFGDSAINNTDLIATLRAITKVPGFRPGNCTDRFDAMDSFPVDTATTIGGDGFLNNLDLITTLRRSTNVDTTRPKRAARNGACGLSASPQPVAQSVSAGGGIEYGAPAPRRARHGVMRVPLYLASNSELSLSGLSYSMGSAAALRFVPDGALPPSLIDSELPGVVAVAYLQSIHLNAGERLLLGTVEITGADADQDPGSLLQVYGIEANSLDGLSIAMRYPGSSRAAQ